MEVAQIRAESTEAETHLSVKLFSKENVERILMMRPKSVRRPLFIELIYGSREANKQFVVAFCTQTT